MSNISKVKISIRRKQGKGLPGDDVTLHNLKIGSALKGSGGGILRGLNFEEEKKYLPEIINISPTDNEWRKMTQDYWNNISVVIPADGTTIDKLQGKVLDFTVSFKNKQEKDNFEEALKFETKAQIISEHGEVIEGIANYVLFRYALVYSKVANSVEDIDKSAKILFYLYSKQTQTKLEHKSFKKRNEALAEFIKVLPNEGKINAILMLFEQDLASYETLEDKHLALEALVKTKPATFLSYIKDENLSIKAAIKKAVEAGIINNPPNTTTFYYGGNNEHTLGTTLENAVLYLKSEEQKNKQIWEAIKSQLKNG